MNNLKYGSKIKVKILQDPIIEAIIVGDDVDDNFKCKLLNLNSYKIIACFKNIEEMFKCNAIEVIYE